MVKVASVALLKRCKTTARRMVWVAALVDVPVFIIISGFLITGILWREVSTIGTKYALITEV